MELKASNRAVPFAEVALFAQRLEVRFLRLSALRVRNDVVNMKTEAITKSVATVLTAASRCFKNLIAQTERYRPIDSGRAFRVHPRRRDNRQAGKAISFVAIKSPASNASTRGSQIAV
jgi:hypothetical protein